MFAQGPQFHTRSCSYHGHVAPLQPLQLVVSFQDLVDKQSKKTMPFLPLRSLVREVRIFARAATSPARRIPEGCCAQNIVVRVLRTL